MNAVYPIPARLNKLLFALLLAGNAYQFFLLPLLLLPRSMWWALTLVPLALTNNALWYLAHESFHGNLHPDKAWNERMGRILCIAFGAPFHVVRFGHLMHHRFNRSALDRPDVWDPRKESAPLARLKYYFNLCGGLWLQEFLSPVVFMQPRERVERTVRRFFGGSDPDVAEVRELTVKTLLRPETIEAVRLDGVAIWWLTFVSLVMYGANFWLLPLVLGARAFMISFADNLPHYGTGISDRRYAKMLELPRLGSLLLLNFNHHRLHHHDTSVPWIHLPEAMRARGERYDEPYFTAGAMQLRGPIEMSRAAALGG